MISWHIITSEEYNNADPSLIDNDKIYFLSDTKEIKQGKNDYNESFVLYEGDLPTESIAKGKIYINSQTLKGSIYIGFGQWADIINPIGGGGSGGSNINVDDTVTSDSDNPVSSKAIVTYIAQEIEKAQLGSVGEDGISKPIGHKVTLLAANWSNNQQSILINGISDDETKQFIQPVVAFKDFSAYEEAEILASQSLNRVIFKCQNVPTEDIDLYIIIQNVVIV